MPRRTEDLEIRMIEEAIHTIETDGEAAIRVRDICAACGAREPALYLRFGSRAGLIVAAQSERYRRTIDILVQRTIKSLATAMTSRDLDLEFRDIIRWGFDPHVKNRLTRLNVLGSAVSRPQLAEAITEANNEAVAELSRAIDFARTAGIITPLGSSEALAAWYLGTVTSRAIIELPGSIVNADEWTEVFITAIAAVLFATDEVAPAVAVK
jgi:AcrR family transcriptional regulator